MNPSPKPTMSLVAAISIGIGGMVGAGIFSILGVAAESAGNALWLSFLIGGVVAGLSTYSYAKLGATFPSSGGAVEYLVRGFDDGVLSGGINIFLWIGYVIALALYANAFGGYAATFVPGEHPAWLGRGLAVSAVVLFTGVNMLGAQSVGKSETVIVAIKVAILVVFAAVGVFSVQTSRLAVSEWPALPSIISGAGIIFMGYEGFGLVANSAGSMNNPKITLPKALYLSVGIVTVIYLAVSITVLGNLSIPEMVAKKDYALAQAAKPFLGEFGFKLIAVAAVLSTASAINATLFGAANVSYLVAKDGQLPASFTRRSWGQGSWGLIITSALVVVFLLIFDLAGIAMMGSAAFLLIYASVNAAHLRITAQTGGNRVVVALALVACLVMFGFLAEYTYRQQPAALGAMVILLVGSFVGEMIYRRVSGRKLAVVPSSTRA